MKLRILYHGNCFDGSASAGLFARFFREQFAPGSVEVVYTPLQHKGDAQPITGTLLDGDDNACVDFRYSQDARLTWWFDHHASAFQLPGDEAHFRADTSGKKFYDPSAKSCTRFLANTLAKSFGSTSHVSPSCSTGPRSSMARFFRLLRWQSNCASRPCV